jgi:hypothetical protein
VSDANSAKSTVAAAAEGVPGAPGHTSRGSDFLALPLPDLEDDTTCQEVVAKDDKLKDDLKKELILLNGRARAWYVSTFAGTNLGELSVSEQTAAVLAWWRDIAGDFPNLRIVAAKLFSVRVTSASAERLFSFAGLLKTALRNRMSPPVFDALIAYSYNNPRLQQDRAAKAEQRRGKPRLKSKST